MAANPTIEEFEKIVAEQMTMSLDFTEMSTKMAALPKWIADWASRRHFHQSEVDALEDRSDDFKSSALARYKASEDAQYANMSDTAFVKKISDSKEFKAYRRQIRSAKRVVEYLDEILGAYKFQFGKSLAGLLKIRELDG